MPRKRIKSKKKFNIDYRRLTDDLYEAICKYVSLEEMLGGYEHLGYKYGQYFVVFDKNDPKVCRKIWNLHKKAVMDKWEADDKAGSRPFLWWVCERPENIKIIRYEKYTNMRGEPKPVELPDGSLEYKYPIYENEARYLERLGLLEDWEIKVLKERSPDFEEEGTDDLPYEA